MASREELLGSIQPGTRLTKDFFKRIYGYEITQPGFADLALETLEAAGCSRVREYYICVVAEIDHGYDKDRKEVAAWYVKECDKQFQKFVQERGEEEWRATEEIRRRRVELLKKKELLLKRKKQLSMQRFFQSSES